MPQLSQLELDILKRPIFINRKNNKLIDKILLTKKTSVPNNYQVNI